jgi:hypothetical protein
METSNTSFPNATECYKCWTAYSALTEAAFSTNYRSVWYLLSCECCPEPLCWQSQEILPVPANLTACIRWYDNIQQLPQHYYNNTKRSSKPLSPEEMCQLQEHFVSHHQRIELVLHCLKPSLDQIYELVRPYVDTIHDMAEDVVQQVIDECKCVANGWCSVGRLMRGVALMDRMKYLDYVPRLAGVSGGDSPTMIPLTVKTGNLESLLTKRLSTTKELAQAIRNHSAAGQLAEAFLDCLDSLSRCWFDHVVTATTVIGFTKGTQGTPNKILVDRVLHRLHSSKLLIALGSLRGPMSGGIGIEMQQLYNYQSYPLANHYLDIFVDPGPEFGSHNVGWQPKEYDRARAGFLEIFREKRAGIRDYFYSQTRPEFCQQLSNLLGVRNDSTLKFSFGSCVAEVLSRLIISLQLAFCSSNLHILLADDECVAMQREAVILQHGGASVKQVPAAELKDHVFRATAKEYEVERKESGSNLLQLVMTSLVNSCNQHVQDIDWVRHVPNATVVIVDISQAVANVPLAPFAVDQLASRPNVFFVGSLSKHARCGENLGFMTYADGPDRRLKELWSEWGAYVSGSLESKTAKADLSCLLYGEGLQWDGDTPSYVEAAHVATRILKTLPSVEAQHEYVKSIQKSFLSEAKHLLSEKQLSHVTDSNTLAIPVNGVLSEPLPFGLDYKTVNGVTYLRIAFGIHNLQYHLVELVSFLQETSALM